MQFFFYMCIIFIEWYHLINEWYFIMSKVKKDLHEISITNKNHYICRIKQKHLMEDKKLLDTTKAKMEKSIQHLEIELAKIRAGKANPAVLDNVMVEYYGTKVPISQTASINTLDARTLVIQPWEKSMLTPLEKAIQIANLGFNPQNDGTVIRITVPPLTEERRKELVKMSKQIVEDAKIGIRNARKEAMEAVKKLQKNGMPEDEAKILEQKVQKLTDEYIVKCDKHLELKEKEIMTV